MCKRCIISLVIAIVLSLKLNFAYAIGEWCQPFIILKSIPSGQRIDSWVQNIQLETHRIVDPDAQFIWDASAPVTTIPEIVAQLQQGKAAMALVDTSQLVKMFPSLYALDFPGLNMDPNVISNLYTSGNYLQYVEEEMSGLGISVLALGHVPYALLSSREGLKSIDDLNGQRILSGGGVQARLLEEMGAVPVQIPYTGIVDKWRAGVIEGAIVPTHHIYSAGLESLTKSAIVSAVYAHNVMLLASEKFITRASEDAVIGFKNIAKETSLEYTADVLVAADEEISKLDMFGITVTEFSITDAIGDSGHDSIDLWQSYLQEYDPDFVGGIKALMMDLGG